MNGIKKWWKIYLFAQPITLNLRIDPECCRR
jgi:hypothetical protein